MAQALHLVRVNPVKGDKIDKNRMKAEEGDVRAGPFGEPALFFCADTTFSLPASVF
jgi:hypothetical protein